MDELIVVPGDEEQGTDPLVFDAWLVRDGVTVGFLDGNIPCTRNDFVLHMGDIETRKGHRNNGVATTLINLVKNHFGASEVVCSGEFTPDGYDYLRHKIGTFPGYPVMDFPIYDPMTFVGNWDDQEKKLF